MLKETILIDEAYLSSLLEALGKAKLSIDFETYIFENDSVGKRIAASLCQAAKRGVKIRLLIDGIGSMAWGGSISKQMELVGIKIKVFHPLPWKISHWGKSVLTFKFIISKIVALLSKINSRNHRKICIIDKNIVFAGSANIYDHLIDTEKYGKKWRETSVKLYNVNTKEIAYAFDKAWGRLSLKKRLQHKFQKKHPDPIFNLNYSWRQRYQFYHTLIDKISNCRKRIWVTNAYFVPDLFLLKTLIAASKRGVDVRILLPSKSDLGMVSMVSKTFYAILLKNGILIYEYLPTVLHAKVLILDDWCSIGSSNLNHRSFKHDLEVTVNIKTDAAKQNIADQFSKDLKQARQIKINDINNQPLYKKWFARSILLIRYWL